MKIMKCSEMAKIKDERKFVINGLPLQNIGILAGTGASDLDKTYFIFDFAMKYICGHEHILTKVKAEDRKKILYLSNNIDENSIKYGISLYLKERKQELENDGYTQEIIQTKLESEVKKLKDNFKIILDEDNVMQFLEQIENNEYDLIIFDCFVCVFNIDDENNNAVIAKQLRDIKKILKEKNSAALITLYLNSGTLNVESPKKFNYWTIGGKTTAFIDNCYYAGILHYFKNIDETLYSEIKIKNKKAENYQVVTNSNGGIVSVSLKK